MVGARRQFGDRLPPCAGDALRDVLGADAEVDVLWPALTTAALAAVLVWAAVKVFERREL